MATTKPKRKGISKSTRFEVFKRDSFKCQYCGKCAPDVILNVDHINPVSKGGENEILNYITACQDCNAGKSDRLLGDDSVMAKQRAQLEELNERREQLEQMLAWRDGMRDIDGMALSAVVDAWNDLTEDYSPNEKGLANLKGWIAKFGVQEILDAIEKSARYLERDAAGALKDESIEIAFRKIGGIARMSTEPDWKRDLYYIRGIARNRFNYVDNATCMLLLEDAYHLGVDIETLRNTTLRARNWSGWAYEMRGLIGSK